MSLTRVVFILSFLLFLNCEDKQSKKNNAVKPENSTTATELKKDVPQQDSALTQATETEKSKEEPFKLSDQNVTEFMLQYGKENPETLVKISTTYGDIMIKLYKETPIHRANFLYLVKEKYFNETFFYRAAKDFVIQGGNSDRQQMADKRFQIGEYTVPQEQVKGLKHVRGAVALSKQWVNNPSNRSTPFEFFIVVAKKGAPHLDGEHTIFGKVIKGISVADKISNVPVDQSEWPKENIFIKAEVVK